MLIVCIRIQTGILLLKKAGRFLPDLKSPNRRSKGMTATVSSAKMTMLQEENLDSICASVCLNDILLQGSSAWPETHVRVSSASLKADQA